MPWLPLLSFSRLLEVLTLRDPGGSAALALLVVLHMAAEGPRGGELAELVPDHRLGDEHRDVLASVVHGDRVAEHLGDDRRAPRPGLDDVLRALVVLRLHLLEQVVVDERALLQAARHVLSPSAALTRGVAAADDQPVTRLALATGAALGLTLRVDRVATTGGLTLTTTVRV